MPKDTYCAFLIQEPLGELKGTALLTITLSVTLVLPYLLNFVSGIAVQSYAELFQSKPTKILDRIELSLVNGVLFILFKFSLFEFSSTERKTNKQNLILIQINTISEFLQI